MGIASIVHIYVFPAKPYELMGDHFSRNVSIPGDYVSADPLDPNEVKDSEGPTKLRLPRPDADSKSGMTIRESVCDVVLGAGEYIVNDLKFTVNHAVEPVEKGFTRFNEKLHKISEKIKKHKKEKKRTKDDSCIGEKISEGGGGARGRGKKHRRKSGYKSAESGESSRWITED